MSLSEIFKNTKKIEPDDLRYFIHSILSGQLSDSDIVNGLKVTNQCFGDPLNPPTEFVKAASTVMRDFMIPIKRFEEVCDTCGTGGDGKNLFNVSSLAALTVASCGLTVAKHGNRAVSGSFGSADFYEALGFDIMQTPEMSESNLDRKRFAFLFAPIYHPAMKFAAAPRKKLGVRTIFNCLGPLVNPAHPSHQTIGVFSEALMHSMLKASVSAGVRNVSLVHACDGTDEVTTWCSTKILFARNADDSNIQEMIFEPAELGIATKNLNDFRCDNRDDAMRMADCVIEGSSNPHTDLVAINAAVTLWTAGRTENLADAFEMARENICSGELGRFIQRAVSNA